jgi:hypothetical protein
MIKRLLILLLVMLPGLALGQQGVQLSGPATPGHSLSLIGGSSPAFVQDSGPANGGVYGTGLAELGITQRAPSSSGPNNSPFCINDGPISAGYHQLCLTPSTGAAVGMLTWGAYNGASAEPFECSINGIVYNPCLGSAASNVIASGSTASGYCAISNGTSNPYNIIFQNCPGVTTPGGSPGQVQINYQGVSFAGITISGDCTLGATGQIICTSTDLVPFAASATIDTTNASNITSGTLASARCFTATTSLIGCVKPDGTTITINGSGVISSAAASSTSLAAPQGRLTLISGTPFQSSPQMSTAVYYDCYTGNTVPIYNGTSMVAVPFTSGSCEVGLALSTTQHVSGKLYDVYGINNSGVLAICTGPAWSGATTRTTGSGTPNLTQVVGGVYTNSASFSACWNGSTNYGTIGTNEGTYLGTIYVPAATAQLNTTITGTTTSIPVFPNGCGTGTYCFPTSQNGMYVPFYILIDSEIMEVTGGNGTSTWTITRGQLGTTAASHSEGATISMSNGQTICTIGPTAGTSAGFSPPVGDSPQCDYNNAYNRQPMSTASVDRNPSIACGFAVFDPVDAPYNTVLLIDGPGDSFFVQSTFHAVTGNSGAQYEIAANNTQFGVDIQGSPGASLSMAADARQLSGVTGIGAYTPICETSVNGAILVGELSFAFGATVPTYYRVTWQN